MALEFLLVAFPSKRTVLADGGDIGSTNDLLLVAPGTYEITLSGGKTMPASISVNLSGTTATSPKKIAFSDANAVGST
jgi:hypothetical protein